MIWPSAYIQMGLLVWWIIISGLLVEFIFIKFFTKDSYLKCAIMAITINAISTLLGLTIYVVSFWGFIVEIMLYPIDRIFNIGTFHISHWILAILGAALCNTLIEGLALKFIFKKIFKKIFLWLFVANLISVIFVILVM
jgi:hypothetical protein